MTPDDFYILMDVLDESGMDYMDMMEYLMDLEAWVDVYPNSDENDISQETYMRNNKRTTILLIFVFMFGIIGSIIRFQNPDMTEMRLFLTYSKEIAIVIVIQFVLMFWWWKGL